MWQEGISGSSPQPCCPRRWLHKWLSGHKAVTGIWCWQEMCSVVASVPPPHQATRATSSLLMGCGSLKTVVLLWLLFCWGGKWSAVNDLWPCLSITFSIINPPLPQHSHQRSLSQMFEGPFHLLSPCCSASCHSLPGCSHSQAGFALSFSSSGQACLTSSLILLLLYSIPCISVRSTCL